MANTTLVKQGQNLIETSKEEAAKLATQPLSPKGAKEAGANEYQSRMAGTPAQKAPILKAAVDGGRKTLQEAQRYKTQAQFVAPNAQTQEKLATLKSLGGIQSQLQTLIEGKIQQAQDTKLNTLQVDQEALESQQLEQEKTTALNTALGTYAQATTPEAKAQALTEAQNILGRQISADELQGYFKAAPEAISGAIKAVTPEEIRLGDLDLTELGGVDELASLLGITPEEVSGMNIADLNSAIQRAESSGFNEIQDIQAQLVSATGARREILLRRLGELQGAGVEAQQEQFNRIQQQIAEGQTFNIAGQQLSLEDIVKDDELSDIVKQAASSEEELSALEREMPELGAWIRDNLNLFKEEAATATATTAETQRIQQEMSTIINSLPEELKGLVDPEKQFYTEADLDAIQAQVEDGSINEAILSNDALKNSPLLTPEVVNELSGVSKETINELFKVSDNLLKEPDVAAFMGVDVLSEGMITSPAEIRRYNSIKTMLGTVDVTMRKELADSKAQGLITEKDLGYLVQNKDKWPKIKVALDNKQKVQKVSQNFDSLVDYLFGEDKSIQDINKDFSKLRNYAALGHEPSLRAYMKLKPILQGGSKNRGLDEGDFEALKKLASQGVDIKNIAKGGAAIQDSLNTTQNLETLGASSEVEQRLGRQVASGNLNKLSSFSTEELTALSNLDSITNKKVKEVLNRELSRRKKSEAEAMKAKEAEQAAAATNKALQGILGDYYKEGSKLPNSIVDIDNMLKQLSALSLETTVSAQPLVQSKIDLLTNKKKQLQENLGNLKTAMTTGPLSGTYSPNRVL